MKNIDFRPLMPCSHHHLGDIPAKLLAGAPRRGSSARAGAPLQSVLPASCKPLAWSFWMRPPSSQPCFNNFHSWCSAAPMFTMRRLKAQTSSEFRFWSLFTYQEAVLGRSSGERSTWCPGKAPHILNACHECCRSSTFSVDCRNSCRSC